MACPRNKVSHRTVPRALLPSLLALVALALWPASRSVADVVPPRAIEVAEGWLALVDDGRYREAVAAYFDPEDPRRARETIARLTARDPKRATAKPAYRTIRSWTGHGAGDSSRMEPGAYFSLVFDTAYATGPNATDEVRMIPRGDGEWRIVDYRTRVEPRQPP